MIFLRAGSVTFLFTDIEGSTRLLAELGAKRYRPHGITANHQDAVNAEMLALRAEPQAPTTLIQAQKEETS